jgi:hypothetical protein
VASPSHPGSGRPAGPEDEQAPGERTPGERTADHAIPELELDLRSVRAPAPRARAAPVVEGPLELAVDPRALVRERFEAASVGSLAPLARIPSERPDLHVSARPGPTGLRVAPPAEVEFASDARLLADYGDPPRSWARSPLYAYRVLKRRRELRAAIGVRQEEAKRAAAEAEAALVALAGRVRETAEKTEAYAEALDELRTVEALLRSRDQVLATEDDAQKARLSQVDARLSNLEADLTRAQGEERALGAQLADAAERQRRALAASRSEHALQAPEAVGRAASVVAELVERHAAARRHVSEAGANVEAARAERRSLENWFKRKMGTRTVAVEEAREDVRQRLLAIAKRAAVDHAAFGDELDPARKQIATLESAARSAARDVLVHDTAMGAYDAGSLRQGVLVAGFLVLVLIVAPVVWRAVRVVEPPVPVGHVTAAP